MNFEWMRRRPRTALGDLLDRLAVLPTIAATRQAIEAKGFAKRPTVPFEQVTGDRMPTLIEAFEALIAHPPEPANAKLEALP